MLVNGTEHNADNYFYIPKEVTSYNSVALRYFSNVKKVCLPSAMKVVSGFKYHNYLTNVILPSSVEEVEEEAFKGCSALERIVCLATTVPFVVDAIASNPSEITLRVPYYCVSDYQAADYWKEFNIEEGSLVRWAGTYTLKSLAKRDLSDRISDKVLSWSSSNTNYATVDNGVVSASDYKYDGTIASPYRGVTITAITENADVNTFTVRIQPREVVLTDGNAYKNTVDFEAEKISYTRSFSKAGAWFALYLPFAIDIEAYKNDFDIAEIFTICPTTDTNGDGIVDASDSKKLILSRLNSGMTQPNAPYMIRTKAAKEYTIVSNNTTLASAEINEVEFATSRSQYTVKGIYDAGFYVKPVDNNYYMATSGSVSFATTKNVNIKPNRWFMHEEAKDYCGSSASNSASKFIIEVVGEDLDETTAIKLINGETVSSNGKSNSAYNINGMKVDASKNLPSGLYIINGKKVFKK